MSAAPSAFSVMRSSRLSITPGAVCFGCIGLALNPLGLFLPFLCSAALHELGHWAVLRLYHVPAEQLRITALGCVMRTAPLSYRVEARCAFAGPGVNFLLFMLSVRIFPAFALVNLSLALFNLLPLWPLDGGRLLRAMLCSRLAPDNAQKAESWIAAVTVGLIWMLAAWATCYLHMGLAPAVLAAGLTLRMGQEKLVAKNRG